LLGRHAAEAAGDAGLIVRIALGRAVEAVGEAGPIIRITSGLDGLLVPALLGRRAAEGAGDASPIVRIASEVAEEPVGFVELDGLFPASLGLRAVERRKVSAPRSFFRGDWSCGFFLGDPPAASDSATPPLNLAPRAGFRRAGTDLKLFETFGPLGAPLPCFFPADVALANTPAAPSSPPFVWRDGLMRGGVAGAMMLFYLIWLVSRSLLGEKVRPQGVLFRVFLESRVSDTNSKLVGYQFLPSST